MLPWTVILIGGLLLADWLIIMIDRVKRAFVSYYFPPAHRPGTGDYKMPCVRASMRASRFHKSLCIS